MSIRQAQSVQDASSVLKDHEQRYFEQGNCFVALQTYRQALPGQPSARLSNVIVTDHT